MSQDMRSSIAVIGMACHYPGARSPRELWENVLARRQEFRRFLEQRMPAEDYHRSDPDEPDCTYGKLGAFIDGFEFDPIFRRVPKSTFVSTDITHWLALEVAAAAIQDAGYAEAKGLPRERTGVILGNSLTGEQTRANTLRLRWPYVRRKLAETLAAQGVSEVAGAEILEAMKNRYLEPFAPTSEDTLAGSLSNTISGRICGYFDFGGGGYVVDGACSSSLLAVCTAASALIEGRVDVCIAGGVDISLDPFELVGFAKARALTPTDMRVYDRRGNGFIPGEGCGFVVLKRLEDAKAAGDRIYASIVGWGISSDGKNAITAPKIEGQARAIRDAWKRGGIPDFVEGHGTGTAVGDRVELEAIAQVAGAGKKRRIGVTSLKSIIGHTKAAAGIGAFIKAVAAVNRRVIPPTAGCSEPNDVFGDAAQSLYPVLRGQVKPSDSVLKAGVSAMGFGGINSHVVLVSENPPDPALTPTISEPALLASTQDTEIFVFAAESNGTLRKELLAARTVALGLSRSELADYSSHLLERRLRGPVRAAVLADSPEILAARLERLSALESAAGPEVWLGTPIHPPRIGFLFPGQGSQMLEMGGSLIRRDPNLQALAYSLAQTVTEAGGPDVMATIFPALDTLHDETDREPLRTKLSQTDIAQPAIALISLLWAERLQQLGIVACAAAGHSLGEVTAIAHAGAFSAEKLLAFATLRGRVMVAPEGSPAGMLSLQTDLERVLQLLDQVPGYVAVANVNGPRQVVISGELNSLHALRQHAELAGVSARLLPVSNGFHSELVASAAQRLRIECDLPTTPQALRHPIYSSLVEEVQLDCQLVDHLANHVRAPVDFVSVVRKIGASCDLLIEVGPGQVLSGLCEGILGGTPHCYPVEGAAQRASDLLSLLASAYVRGSAIRWEYLHTGRLCRPFYAPAQKVFFTNPCEMGRNSVENPGSSPPKIFRPDRAASSISVQGSTPTASVATFSEGFLDSLISLVIERTGFDRKLISEEQRLQEDLNLDSIKAGEIIATAAKRAGAADRVDPAQYLRYPLGEIARALASLSTHAGVSTRPPDIHESDRKRFSHGDASESKEKAPPPRGEAPAASLRPDNTLRPVEREWDAAPTWVRTLGLKLEPRDAPAVQPLRDISITVLGNELMQQWLISHGASNSARPDILVVDVRETTLDAQVRLLSNAVGALDPGVKGLLLIQHTGGRFGIDVVARTSCNGVPVNAFARSLSLERPALAVQVLDLSDRLIVEEGYRALTRFLPSRPGFEARGVSPEGWVEPIAGPLARPTPLSEKFRLKPGDLVLVTGGARGITAACARELARTSGCRLALVGSTPGDRVDDEVIATLGRCALEGITARYFGADLSSQDAVTQLVKDVQNKMGMIHTVVHGAGKNVPCRLEKVSAEAALDEIAPKLLGARYLLDVLTEAPPCQFIALTSIIGVCGMQGNAWYAFANEALDGIAGQFAAHHEGCRVHTLAYGVWSEIGMGARMGSVEGLARMGIGALRPSDGVQRFMDIVTQETEVRQSIVTAQLAGLPTWPGRLTPHPDLVFQEGQIRGVAGVCAQIRLQLHPDKHQWLRDHNFKGSLLLPTVMGLEAMAQSCVLALATENSAVVFHKIEQIRLSAPVVVAEEGAEVEIRALIREYEPRVIDCEIRTEQTGFARAHFSATFFLADHEDAAESVSPPDIQPVADPLIPERDLYGGLLFQGKAFHRMGPVKGVGAGVMAFEGEVKPSFIGKTVLGDPFFRDALLQAGQLLIPQDDALPEFIERIQFFQGATSVGPRRVIASHLSAEANTHRGEVWVLNVAGKCVERIDGYCLRVLAHHPERATLNEILNPDVFNHRLVTQSYHALIPTIDRFIDVLIERESLHAMTLAARHNRENQLVKIWSDALDLSWTDLGQPLLNSGEGISISHDDTHCLLVRSPTALGCDLETVTPRDWMSLLSPPARALWSKARAMGDSPDEAGTRLWAVIEALKKVGGAGQELEWVSKDGARVEFSASSRRTAVRLWSWILPFARGPRKAIAIALPTLVEQAQPSSVLIQPEFHQVHLRRGNPDWMETRFIVPFDDSASMSGLVPAYALAGWMGKLRELALAGLREPLLTALDGDRFGMVTQQASVQLETDAGALDQIEARTWVEELRHSSCLLRFEFRRQNERREWERLGQAAQRFGWVEILGHAQVRGAPFPDYLERFLASLHHSSPISVSPPLELPQQPPMIRGSFPTTFLESNVVGNLYYAHYFRWPQRLVDQWIWSHSREMVTSRGRTGELQIGSMRLEYLREAMPFDTIEVSMHLRWQKESDLSFSVLYQRLEPDGTSTRLALGQLDAQFIQRDSNGRARPATLPSFLTTQEIAA